MIDWRLFWIGALAFAAARFVWDMISWWWGL
jgi:hypothetical protein